MDCPQHDSLCVTVYCSRRWIIYHTENTDMKLHMFLHALAECESKFTQSTMVCNLAGITLQVVHHRSHCSGYFTVWISSVYFPWFMEMNSATHRAQRYKLSPTWYFICLCLPFQEMKHLPHWGHWQDDTKYVFFSCGGWIWNNCHIDHNNIVISLTWLFMCIVWWFLMLFLNISSTRNHLFLQRAFYRANSCWILLASLCLFHPPGIILL